MKENKTNCGIYEIKNLITNKVYIGSSSNLKSRKSQHFSSLKLDKHCNSYLQRSYNKLKKEYGENEVKKYLNFKCIKSLEKIEDREKLKKDLVEWENYYLEDYRNNKVNLYNIRDKAENNIGHVVSEKTKNKISKALKGVKRTPRTEETKNKISTSQKGRISTFKDKKHTKESKNKMSMSKKDKKFTIEHREKIKKNHKKPCAKKVINLTTNETFESITEASKFYNINASSIGAVCRERRKTAGDYKWRFN